MTKQEYYDYSKTYEYNEESPYTGALADGVEEATILSGEVTWSADITWNESLEQYEIFKTWNDHDGHFSNMGEGPLEDDFLNDVYSFLQSKGIDSAEVTY
ncbi:hypothetical protein YH66_15080 [[Brevibacterium] flavum]|uniref:Uncharacterized protein n=1 Tax=[Brevibacterium] flavum TaxID=92706 RepID=A0A0F6Z7X2_9CORY|nr:MULTISPECIES: hypothetical protein [Corynebacterium]AJE68552.1 hypothetical protein SB89_14055 [Corynebacterium glutamicum]AKF28753.1 hypothetical protein YH66_15080 [[Brevibacterium] flavum]ALP51349.1 hypothetical protein AC079_14820 [Corynebacterium glutamicum]ANE09606.1 hypothetical protein A3654_15290 [Corynebacterium glutamicum]ANR63849.1 hypothetical protein C628_14845 [[Brevibacterium] flavum ZL-1]